MRAVKSWTIVTLVAVLAAAAVAGAWFYRLQEGRLRSLAETNLLAVAEFKAAEIAHWRRDRLKSPGVTEAVLEYEIHSALCPALGSWPVPSTSAESLLVRRDGDSVRFLGGFRHRQGVREADRIPLTQTNVPAVMAVLGREGVFAGTDYRGVEVFSALKAVPGAPWFLVAKVDQAEVLEEWALLSRLIMCLGLSVMLVLFLLLRAMWNESRKDHYKALFEAEREKHETEKRLKAEVQTSEERYREIFQSSPVAIWEEDFSAVKARFDELRASGVSDFRAWFEANPDEVGRLAASVRILSVNEASLKQLGVESLDRLILELPRYFTADSLKVFKEELITLAEGGQRFESEIPIVNPSGEGRLLELILTVSQSHRDSLGRVLVSFTDVTAHRQADEDRAKLEAQLQQAMKMEAIGRLAGGVAHDFNNLLGSIIGNIQLAQLDLGPQSPQVEPLAEAGKAAEIAAGLTRQLLAFSRKQIIEPRVVDLNELLRSSSKMLIRVIGEDVVLKTMPGRDLGAVRVDPAQFQQIVINLAVNARDAMPGGGILTLETANMELDQGYCGTHAEARPGSYVMLAVSDNGHGMSDEVRKHLFEPFFTTKPMGRGTGLGLATIYGAVKQAKGLVEVYSEEGVGTTFKIYLPRVDEPVEKAEIAKPSGELPRGMETILLVEDEPLILDMAARLLKRLGYNVLAISDGEKALALAAEHEGKIDLLMTDVVMPGMNGQQLAEKLTVLRPGIRVLFSSGYTRSTIDQDGVITPGLHYLSKPYSMKTLAAKLREILDKG